MLDTVFRLAEEQNPKVALARERVREAYAEKDLAGADAFADDIAALLGPDAASRQ